MIPYVLGFAVDSERNKLYFTIVDTMTVEVSNLDGTAIQIRLCKCQSCEHDTIYLQISARSHKLDPWWSVASLSTYQVERGALDDNLLNIVQVCITILRKVKRLG